MNKFGLSPHYKYYTTISALNSIAHKQKYTYI